MAKPWPGIAIAALSITVVYYITAGRKPPPDPTVEKPTPARAARARPGASLLTLRSLVASPLSSAAARSARPAKPEPRACAELRSRILDLSVRDIEYPPQIDRMPSPAGCKLSSLRSEKALGYYRSKCADAFRQMPDRSLDPETGSKRFEACQVATLVLRSALASEPLRDRPLSEITDERELAELLVAEFGEMLTGASLDSARRMVAIADRMARENPSLVGAVKAAAVGSFLEVALEREAIQKAGTNAPKPEWSSLEEKVQALADANPADPDLDTYRRLVDTEMMSPDRVKQDSLARLQKNPDDADEHKLVAWASWKTGDRETAYRELARAMQLKPGDPDLKKNWDAIHRPNAQPSDFTVQMRLGLGIEDLLK